MRKIKQNLSLFLIFIFLLCSALLFGHFLGGYYIYNLLIGDNHNSQNEQVKAEPIERKFILRLDPIHFYTLQFGVFSEVKKTQDIIDQLYEKNLRPFVTSKPPYKIWLGCFSNKNTVGKLEDSLKQKGFEVFVGEGLVNDRALKFYDKNIFLKNSIAPLLGKTDLVINHSLKMFKSPFYSDYLTSTWDEMVIKIQSEIDDFANTTEKALILEESEIIKEALQRLKENGLNYSNSLNVIKNAKNDEAILCSQGHLLELIAAYHNLIDKANECESKNN